jgi:hypothetical protein
VVMMPLCRRTVLAALVLLVAAPTWGSLRATLEHGAIHEHETVRLTVRVLGDGGPTGEPDFSALERDFEILTTRTSSEFSSIGGRIQSWTAWILTLQPNRTGNIEIPAFTLGPHTSEPIQLRVTPLDSRTRQFIEDQVFFETEVSSHEVYVQAQLLLTRTLFYAEGVQLFGELPREPDVPHALVQPLGEPNIARTTRNGQRYRIIEQRYAIFPERSGQLVIPSASIAGSAILPRAEGFTGRRTAVDARSGEIRIAVLPIPRDYPDGVPWFPAGEVELLESWDKDPPVVDAGQPLARALIVRAEETMASMVPPLAPSYPNGVRFYAERPDLHETAALNGVVGTRVEAGSIVGQAPGSVELPPVELIWFDTRAHRIRRASVPARTVEVHGTGGYLPEVVASAVPDDVTATPQSAETTGPSRRFGWTLWPMAVALGVVLAWRYRRPLFAMGWSLARRRPWKPERSAYHALRAACRSGNAHDVHAALGDWLQRHYRTRPAEARAAFARDPDARALLAALDLALYAPGAARTYDAAPLLRLVQRRRNANRRRFSSPDSLPPLYPDWQRGTRPVSQRRLFDTSS